MRSPIQLESVFLHPHDRLHTERTIQLRMSNNCRSLGRGSVEKLGVICIWAGGPWRSWGVFVVSGTPTRHVMEGGGVWVIPMTNVMRNSFRERIPAHHGHPIREVAARLLLCQRQHKSSRLWRSLRLGESCTLAKAQSLLHAASELKRCDCATRSGSP